MVGVAAACLARPVAHGLAARRAARRAEPRAGAKCRRRAARAPGRRRRSRVGVLLVALAGSGAGSLSAGELLTHGAVVWLTNIITFGLLFWLLDEGGPRVRAERGRPDPDFQFPQDAVCEPLEPEAERLPIRFAHQCDRGQPDRHDATNTRAKGLMAVESLISYAVVILVVSRAVNVLGAST